MRILPERITLFDFDSCCEHWYAYEIATFLHFFGGGQDEATRRQVYEEVLDGYASVAPLDDRTLAAIPLFGKMRLLYSFLVFAEAWGFKGLSPEQETYFAVRRRLFKQDPTWPARGNAPSGV
jgi:Ser/Thr protein kinase RdoA (MazF antagonist)